MPLFFLFKKIKNAKIFALQQICSDVDSEWGKFTPILNPSILCMWSTN